jgi:hypothetical protein
MDYALRAGTLDDVPAIAAVHVQSWQTSYRHILPAEFLDGLDVARRAERRANNWSRNLLIEPSPLTLVPPELIPAYAISDRVRARPAMT